MGRKYIKEMNVVEKISVKKEEGKREKRKSDNDIFSSGTGGKDGLNKNE